MLISILVGCFICFFGLKQQKIVLTVVWFLVGYFVIEFFLEHSSVNETLLLVLQIFVGIILGVLSLKIQKAAWFIVLFLVGFFLILLATSVEWYFIILAVIVGIIFGVVAVYAYEPMIIITTSLTGAHYIISSLINVLTQNLAISIISNIIYIVLVIAGLYVQFSAYHKENKKPISTKKVKKVN